ncbi:MAG: transporter-associated protein EcsC [Ferruginibacter sp.]|uniref:EcsC family protein n=1 Tax=Ferruginibacter sp. TaxID=1940288 RepID=UPI002658263C|nr:EcsC family protein [Ferruginibacter sp.]MDB5278151.1 transporter-associated protein EcsC [Ferruginibacter sp.]
MDSYQQEAFAELVVWQNKMIRRPTILNKLASTLQTKINSWIPEKIHVAITTVIKQMIRGVLFGAKYTTAEPLTDKSLEVRETAVQERIKAYRNTAAVEGGITGAGGILLGLADFPLLIGIKIKLLFDIAALYGFDVANYKERVYILHIFELAFSSHAHRKDVYLKIADWENYAETLPANMEDFDWRKFQQEYRDYIDLAKMAQLVPVIGAPVGVIANYQLIKKLGVTAMNAYRMRLFK